MRKHITKIGLVSSALTLAVLSGSAVFALPPQANAHAQTGTTNDPGTSQTTTAPADAQARLAAAKLRACQNRENAVKKIIGNIDTRAQNQLTLFNTIATRVENFYTSKGKTVSNYDQLTAAITTAQTQAQTDLATMESNSTFSCTDSNPKGMVTAFQGYLKTEITDLKNYRTAVKNLIVAVAKANSVTVSTDSQTNTTQGGQQ